MRIILNRRTDPAFNIAAEEYMMTGLSGGIFSLWRNRKAVIVGRNQNTMNEINPAFLEEHGIPVIRRMTGGGAVFHDLGNLCFTFIADGDASFSDFSYYTAPIVHALHELGLPAELSGRNDILLSGKKISGNAQRVIGRRVLHHGTLLYSSNLEDLHGALKTDPLKIQGRGIRSVSERVTNISDLLSPPMTIEAFSDYLVESVMQQFTGAEISPFSPEEEELIEGLVRERYGTWEWNYGKTAEYTFSNKKRLPYGIVEARLNVKDGLLRGIRFYGDYFGRHDVAEIEHALLGARHYPEDVRRVLEAFTIPDYFLGATVDDLMQVLF